MNKFIHLRFFKFIQEIYLTATVIADLNQAISFNQSQFLLTKTTLF